MKSGGQLFVGTMLIDDYVQLPDGKVTRLEDLNPLLREIPLWQAYPADSLNGDYTNCFAPNMRGLAVALGEAQFRVESSRIVSMGGYVRAVAIEDELSAKYQRLDARLEKTPFDPSVPYFLDEEGSRHSITGRRSEQKRKGRWQRWWDWLRQ